MTLRNNSQEGMKHQMRGATQAQQGNDFTHNSNVQGLYTPFALFNIFRLLGGFKVPKACGRVLTRMPFFVGRKRRRFTKKM